MVYTAVSASANDSKSMNSSSVAASLTHTRFCISYAYDTIAINDVTLIKSLRVLDSRRVEG